MSDPMDLFESPESRPANGPDGRAGTGEDEGFRPLADRVIRILALDYRPGDLMAGETGSERVSFFRKGRMKIEMRVAAADGDVLNLQ